MERENMEINCFKSCPYLYIPKSLCTQDTGITISNPPIRKQGLTNQDPVAACLVNKVVLGVVTLTGLQIVHEHFQKNWQG